MNEKRGAVDPRELEALELPSLRGWSGMLWLNFKDGKVLGWSEKGPRGGKQKHQRL